MNNAQRKVGFMTLGCKVNTYDSEAMMEIFETAGYTIVDFSEVADVYVINTCTVTHLGDQKSRKMMRKAKRINPNAIICAVGCYVQVAPDEVEKIVEVDLMIGTKNRGDILAYIDAHLQDLSQRDFVSDIMDEKIFEPLMISEVKGKTRAFIKIQEGCNQFCTYCIVPFARGPVRSRNQQQIIDEVNRVVEMGYQEVILSGIHIASYGVDQTGTDVSKTDLIDLIEALDGIEGLKRIRLGSMEPQFITPQRLKRLAGLESFCPHFHLSLQSGSDTVLKRMGRRYTTAEYLEIVNQIRAVFPLAAITTDMMVGFPGETTAEFQETLDFARAVGFYQIHVFKYSRRTGTKAAAFPDQIDETLKNARSHELSELSRELELAFIKKNDGLIAEVLFEATNDAAGYEGHTKNYVPVFLVTDEKINGRIISVRVSYSSRYADKLIGDSII
ncbi:tRNA (N(6)-L-threonylcarbamoyladenosine(37)-C(2))-methylthiotransferase MtaB [Acetobacterium malicum]|uniref:tRNA (N(6)-L-threonylcarbamoyladenosine(37)-C(2))-methylthiotransferase MtaB n=1 Tax=Acetobacterium malicum TaxID=52692 RepID=A0ABR6YVM2_9FIRM|nr:tRNA (N(6)-L-threonylcarbamoyladenosine(37)-C(2))-methylthiotransferase MtaB [Acetobacterium malicum]MBC3899246.1 tRNA (N(6)-L-threonylcarbamoyladenosine(37)-C(2))-methylthiotransferase MtaB [Acetobacterium malicum]